MKNVCVVGLGYIGLPTSLFFANAGYNVYGVDINESIVEELNQGKVTFEEPGLQELFDEVTGKITFTTKLRKADLFIITVPTPFLESKEIDEKYIDSAFNDIASFLENGNSVVLESTVPPKITEKLAPKIEALGFKIGKDIFLGHVPETIIPGNMIKEFKTNKRLIGGATEKCSKVISEFYLPVVDAEIVISDIRTAEFVKVIENTYRDVNIAIANELMRIADKLEIDIYEAIDIANKHPRVNILTPGGGVGGHCISVDPWFLVGLDQENTNLVKAARKVNDSQPAYIFKKYNNKFINKTVGVYGLSYKPDIDDFRESPSFEFIKELKENDIEYVSFDPNAINIVEKFQTLDYNEFLEKSDIVVVYVNHKEVKDINTKKELIILGK